MHEARSITSRRVTMKYNNHTGQAKTCYIECQGIGKDESGKTRYAESHEEYRLVYPQDKPQVKRCTACQEVHKKEVQKVQAARRRETDRVHKAVKEGKNATATLKKIGSKLSKQDQAGLHSLIEAGNKAEAILAKTK